MISSFILIKLVLLLIYTLNINFMEKGIVLKKEIFIKHIKEDVRLHYDI
jgi:hypothetical protein